MGHLLEIQQITKVYGTDTILSEISLTLEAGKALALTGQSGSGKTTLLSIIGLLQQATSGKVVVNGRDITKSSAEEQAKLRAQYFGFVFQRSRLVSSLTTLENVMLPAWFARSGKDAEKYARSLLVRFELTHRMNHRPQELSLGQMRRVALARALVLKPAILLADEPTNDLDPALAASVADSLLQARTNGSSVIIVTHDPHLAARADFTVHLHQGRLSEVSCTGQAAAANG
jgi:ABC-type lipoprotein export system ATPase subunit